MSLNTAVRPPSSVTPERRGRARKSNRPVAWLAPLLAVVTVFYLYPAAQVVRFAFTDAELSDETYSYGLSTIRMLLTDPELGGILRVTLVFVVASVVLQLFLGLIVALLIQRGVRRRLPGSIVVRTVVLSSWVIPGVLVGVVWQIVLNENRQGLVNATVTGLGGDVIPFLSDPQLALATVVIANVWRGTAFSMILQYAGLQAIPPALYEAAVVDGASAWQTFIHVTLPSLRPILMINLILITISTFNTFDMVLALTGGGPGRATEVLALRAYNVLFQQLDLAGASAVALLMLLLTLGLTVVYNRFLDTEG